MSSVTISIPAGFSWVAASLLSVIPVLQYQVVTVARARVKAGIRYPQPYADKAEQEASKDALIFNCVQRAHQNTLENLPIIVMTTLISGIHYPKYAAVACGMWSFLRVIYTKGYSTGVPAKRAYGSLSSLGLQTLLQVLAGKVVYDLFKAGV
ncbi:hypothetical protein EI94DRAFT_1794639 [Lactarius quietus]|nr:hypothetical protein EI94DRAFT_1794639 [Lactarius quietus]